MYLALKHGHLASAIAALLITALWAVVAWRGRSPADGGLSGKLRVIYLAHRAIGGLAALSGLAVTFVGPWRMMIFPYLGLAAFVVHGLAGADAKRTLATARNGRRRVALMIELAALVVAAWLMSAKRC